MAEVDHSPRIRAGEIPPVLFFTIAETAAMFRVAEGTVHKWIKKGIVTVRYRALGRSAVRRVIGYPELNELFDYIAPRSDELKEGSRQKIIMDWHNKNLTKARAAGAKKREEKRQLEESSPT